MIDTGPGIEKIRFWLRCLDHWDRKGHWPEKPIVYDGHFLCMKCSRGGGRALRRDLYRPVRVGAFG